MKTINLPIEKSRADWGFTRLDGTGRAYRTVGVEPDGEVLAWDPVGEVYTHHHSLTEAEMAEARAIAGVHGGEL